MVNNMQIIKYFQTNKNFKYAFSLAEVLIALFIVSIIASITIPSFIKNIEKEKTVTKLKNTYLDINQAIKISEIENGSISKWDRTIVISEYFDSYIEPYLKVLNSEISTITTTSYKKISGGYASTNSGINQLHPNETIKKYNLHSGAQIFVSNSLNNAVLIFIDINGNSLPNQFGKDVFMYQINSTVDSKGIKLIPYGYISTDEFNVPTPMQPTREFLINGTDQHYCCNKDNNGIGMFCGALIMYDNWKIKEDYPW